VGQFYGESYFLSGYLCEPSTPRSLKGELEPLLVHCRRPTTSRSATASLFVWRVSPAIILSYSASDLGRPKVSHETVQSSFASARTSTAIVGSKRGADHCCRRLGARGHLAFHKTAANRDRATMDDLLPVLLSFPQHPPLPHPASDQQYDEGIKSQIDGVKKVPPRHFLQVTSSGEHILNVSN
jgi:hypothetical protein